MFNGLSSLLVSFESGDEGGGEGGGVGGGLVMTVFTWGASGERVRGEGVMGERVRCEKVRGEG